MKYRIEHDSIGELKVPVEALWGVQTQRAVQNFPISGIKPHKVFIEATVQIKKAAARFHSKVGGWIRKRLAPSSKPPTRYSNKENGSTNSWWTCTKPEPVPVTT